MDYRQYLSEGISSCDITIEDNLIDLMLEFMRLVLKKNEIMNLTAIKDELEFIELHLIDSLMIVPFFAKDTGSSIDIGTGAGIPGIVLKIVKSDWDMTLLDSVLKKLNFLREASETLNLDRIQFVHARAEDASKDNTYREKFDIATARAVASLPVLNELCIPFVKVGGRFIAMKGKYDSYEFDLGSETAKKLGAELVTIQSIQLPYSKAERNIIVYQKTKPTALEFPRSMKKIKASI